jgi:hypothetical protein
VCRGADGWLGFYPPVPGIQHSRAAYGDGNLGCPGSPSLVNAGRREIQDNPIPNTPEILAEASAHWADHCFSCHANDGSGDTVVGKNLYPPAPDMRLTATQQLTDGELFYIIQNGIRLTGMPAWGNGSPHDEEDSWKLVHFIRYLPRITLEEKKAMEKLNPKSPDDLREEQEEERFLRGEDSHEAIPEHHHH